MNSIVNSHVFFHKSETSYFIIISDESHTCSSVSTNGNINRNGDVLLSSYAYQNF